MANALMAVITWSLYGVALGAPGWSNKARLARVASAFVGAPYVVALAFLVGHEGWRRWMIQRSRVSAPPSLIPALRSLAIANASAGAAVFVTLNLVAVDATDEHQVLWSWVTQLMAMAFTAGGIAANNLVEAAAVYDRATRALARGAADQPLPGAAGPRRNPARDDYIGSPTVLVRGDRRIVRVYRRILT